MKQLMKQMILLLADKFYIKHQVAANMKNVDSYGNILIKLILKKFLILKNFSISRIRKIYFKQLQQK